jgi:hypothetical protein
MIVIVRDTWRAVLVVVVAVLLRETFAERPAVQATASWPVQPGAWQPVQPPIVVTQAPERPLRRVAQSCLDLADSVIGVVRR